MASGVRLAKLDFICVSVAWVALVHFPPFWVLVSLLGFWRFVFPLQNFDENYPRAAKQQAGSGPVMAEATESGSAALVN